MFTARRSIGFSPNISMRSTRSRMRSASSRISTANSRSGSPTLPSSNWAAPRMPLSGFFTSCASTAAMPLTERAADRNTVCRSSARAAELSCSVSTTLPGSSSKVVACTVMPGLCKRGLSRVMSWSAIVIPAAGPVAIRAKIGLSVGSSSDSAMCESCCNDRPRNCSAAWLAKRNAVCGSSSSTGNGSAPSMAAGVWMRWYERVPTTFSPPWARVPFTQRAPSAPQLRSSDRRTRRSAPGRLARRRTA